MMRKQFRNNLVIKAFSRVVRNREPTTLVMKCMVNGNKSNIIVLRTIFFTRSLLRTCDFPALLSQRPVTLG
jgi:hypothetical protein